MAILVVGLVAGCATTGTGTRTTSRDKTGKGAAIGAGAGAVASVLLGNREADKILAGAVIGAGIGAGVGAYMDHQEERLARIPGTTVERVGDDTLLVNFQSDILFDIDSSILSVTAQGILEQVGEVLLEFPKTAVVVQGFTDSTGSEAHNQSLSERRAGSVRNYFIGRGVDAVRMVAVGYGEGQPVASNDNPDGRTLNRRVNILLKAKAK